MNRTLLGIMILTAVFFSACENSSTGNDATDGIEITTMDITVQPQFYNFDNSEFVETFDLKFYQPGQSYMVGLNGSAGVLYSVSADNDFDTAEMPIDSYSGDDIGESWMDMSTYNPSDHSIQGDGSIYFIRSTSSEWVKLQILSGNPSSFEIKYATMNLDDTFQPAQLITVAYSSEEPAYFNFSSGSVITPEDWHMAFTVVPEYAPGMGFMYMPSILLNMSNDTRMALADSDYSSISEIPGDIAWITDSPENRQLGYNGDHMVLYYHPEPPYNHKVIVENPDDAYFLDTGSGFLKLYFAEYSSGVLQFVYQGL